MAMRPLAVGDLRGACRANNILWWLDGRNVQTLPATGLPQASAPSFGSWSVVVQRWFGPVRGNLSHKVTTQRRPQCR